MLKLYNTLARKKETFRPRKGKKVNIFVCGPTCYDFSHIGHARTYIVFDSIVKYLREKNFDVFYLQNITDIDDKIIKRAKEKRTTPQKLANRFEKEYFKDMGSLRIDSVDKYARATEHIKEIISQVKRLKEKGFAYKIEDGIYYDITCFKDYGKLSGRTVLQAEDAVSRIDESKEKRNKGDFCLWKFSKKEKPKWKSPFGLGRPGWHIEDTAITEKYFGPQYDIHGGARDLIFPHHEAEIAQMEAISNKKPLVKYWLHPGFLTIEGQKMSKSLGNFITIRELLKKHSPEALRLLVLSSHYRSPIDYSKEAILQAEKNLERLVEFFQKIKKPTLENAKKKEVLNVKKYSEKFKKAMEDDFNTPKAFSVIFDFVKAGNKKLEKLSKKDLKESYQFLERVDKIFEIFPKEKLIIPLEVKQLVEIREKYRKEKKFKKADQIRKKIKKLGFWVKDTKQGPTVKKL